MDGSEWGNGGNQDMQLPANPLSISPASWLASHDGSGTLNLDPLACVARALPTELSSKAGLLYLLRCKNNKLSILR